VKTAITNRLRIDRQKELAKKYAAQFEPAVARGENFGMIAAADTGKIARVDTTIDFTMRSSIPSLGLDPVFNATAFSLEPGQVSAEIETNRGIYWQKLLSKTDFDSARFNAQRESLEQRLLAQKKNQAFNDWYDYLKSQADIEDNRRMFNL